MEPASSGAGCTIDPQKASTLDDLRAGLKHGFLLGAAAAVLLLPPAGPSQDRAVPPPSTIAAIDGAPVVANRRATHAIIDGVKLSPDAKTLADWVADSGDTGGLPFAIVDKRGARLYVFDDSARLLSSSLVLLGSAVGDDSAPGIGDRPLSQVRAHERTTAAGRFVSEPGRDDTGERVIWVDYAAALAIHRVKVVDPKERRFERIATDSITDKRISNGCINVPFAFYDAVVEPTFGRSRAVIYVLPEVKSLRQVFPAVGAAAAGVTADGRMP
jgi:hypothetical protein